jgi:hypothetical protein
MLDCVFSLAFLSNNQIEEAYEAYNKAVTLEPANEGYKQNLKIVEDKLKSLHGAAGAGPVCLFLKLIGLYTLLFLKDMGGMGGFMSMFNNPQFINMATQMMSDPQMQNL